MFKPLPAFAAIVLSTALVFPTVSAAADTSSVRVSYADLNLASQPGRARLQGRISNAAKVVCEIEDSRQLDLASATNLCRGDAVERAQPAYEAAVRAALHPSVTVLDAASLIVTAG